MRVVMMTGHMLAYYVLFDVFMIRCVIYINASSLLVFCHFPVAYSREYSGMQDLKFSQTCC